MPSVRGIEVYRWGPAPDAGVVDRAIGQICSGAVDAVVHTSAPGAQALLDAAVAAGRLEPLLVRAAQRAGAERLCRAGHRRAVPRCRLHPSWYRTATAWAH